MSIEVRLALRATRRIASLDEAHPALVVIEQTSTSGDEPVVKHSEDRQGVRESAEQGRGRSPTAPDVARFAHPRQSFPVGLNAKWQVVDHRHQWGVQRRKGNSRAKNSGWEPRFFFRTRIGLLSFLAEYCGEVDPRARATLDAFPEWHR